MDDITVGQQWVDNDPRTKKDGSERVVEILEIYLEPNEKEGSIKYVKMRTLKTKKTSRARADRFRNTQSGYSLKQLATV